MVVQEMTAQIRRFSQCQVMMVWPSRNRRFAGSV